LGIAGFEKLELSAMAVYAEKKETSKKRNV
jgi:hypothetical protein